MRSAWVLVLVLAGCATSSAPDCGELAALEPARNLPLHAFLQLPDDEVAQRFAQAVSDTVVSTEQTSSGTRATTERGTVAVARIPRSSTHTDVVVTYDTRTLWSEPDGSRLEADLRAVQASVLPDVELAIVEQGGRGDQAWLALSQQVGGRATDATLHATLEQREEGLQQVHLLGIRDLADLGPTLDDEALVEMALDHVACGAAFSGVEFVEVHERSTFDGDAVFRRVVLSVDNGCQRLEGEVWVDVQTGAAHRLLEDAHCD